MLGLFHHLFHPNQCYALCAVARSGAHLLTGALQATHLAGRPLQYFHDRLMPKYARRYGFDETREFARYVRGLLASASTDNGVFGFRLESWYLAALIGQLRATKEFGDDKAHEAEVLRTAFPRLRCIQLTREDKLRQAISHARALQSDCWLASKNGHAGVELKFDAQQIGECLVNAARAEDMWRQFFQRNRITPLEVTYEQLCHDYDATVWRVFDFLRIRPPRRFELGPPRTVRQADTLTEEWVERWLKR